MFNCSDDVTAYHDDQVTLPQAERDNMRERRDANRKRLKNGLEKMKRPVPREFASQGSYAMKTMVQHPDNDYDIDDGIYFNKEDLVGERGREISSLRIRQIVCDALDDGCFNKPPEVRLNCVRIYYNAGYHVDMPIYRRVTAKDFFGSDTTYYEIAGTDWKRSDARDVTAWFEKENSKQSPDTDNGRQMRRIVRIIKDFSRSRDSWADKILSGFGITKLVTESFRGNASREDHALYDTMRAIYYRLELNLIIKHPVTPNETITKGDNDPRARFFRERLKEAINNLDPLFNEDCTRSEALKCWDKVFSTTFYNDRGELKSQTKSGLLKEASEASSTGLVFPNMPRVDSKPRGFA